MRDIALTLTYALLLPLVFKYPVMGAYLWAWISLMVPQFLTYGFAMSIPFAYITAVVTLMVFAFTKQRQPLPMNVLTVTLLLMLFWMTVTCFFAMAPRDMLISRWIFIMKIQVMLMVTIMLVRDTTQLRWLIWVVTFSVAFYGVKGGVWTVLTGGGGRVWGPPGGLIAGNNEFAVALVMLVPYMYFLQQTSPHLWVRRFLTLSIVFCCFSILGSQSRGALLGLLAMALLLGLKSKYPVRTSLAIATLVLGAIAFMPDSWSSRMETIGEYTADNSAMSRIWTWKTLWNAAMDHPIVGVGFHAELPEVFFRYGPTDPEFAVFYGKAWVAHSIYFQMLGEHGFVGLALFLALGYFTYRRAGRLSALSKGRPEFETWVPVLMRMVQVSLVGFAAGGAFLSLAYLDLAYYMMAYVVITEIIMKRASAPAASSAAAQAPRPGAAMGGKASAR